MPDLSDPSKLTHKSEQIRRLALFSRVLGELVFLTGLGLAVGFYVWTQWGAPMILVPILSIAGFVLSIYRIYQLSK